MSISILILGNDVNQITASILSIRHSLTDEDYKIFIAAENIEQISKEDIFADKNDCDFMNVNPTKIDEACQKLLDKSVSDSILFLYAGSLLTGSALKFMEQLLNSDKKIGAIGPLMNYTFYNNSNNQRLRINVSYKNLNDLEFLENKLLEAQKPNRKTLVLEGSCLLMRRETLQEIGIPDSQLGAYWSADYSMRLWQAGYELLICSKSYVHSVPMQNNTSVIPFQNKWGFDITYSLHARLELLAMTDLNKENLRVLDLGCACGHNLLVIKDRNPSAELFGVEFNQGAAKVANSFGKVFSADLETWNNDEWNNSFDLIIMADIIEHLKETMLVLKKVYNWLKPGGQLIMSIPNIMNIEVLADLIINGRWEYQDAGILDRTHLRFFTRKEIVIYLQQANFKLSEIKFNQTAITPRMKDLFNALMSVRGNDIFDGDFTAYQWFVKALK